MPEQRRRTRVETLADDAVAAVLRRITNTDGEEVERFLIEAQIASMRELESEGRDVMCDVVAELAMRVATSVADLAVAAGQHPLERFDQTSFAWRP